MNFMPLRLNSSSLTCFICALASIILQLVAMECQKLHMMDSPIDLHRRRFLPAETDFCKFPGIRHSENKYVTSLKLLLYAVDSWCAVHCRVSFPELGCKGGGGEIVC